jgi:hypothetical protein
VKIASMRLVMWCYFVGGTALAVAVIYGAVATDCANAAAPYGGWCSINAEVAVFAGVCWLLLVVPIGLVLFNTRSKK